MSLYRVLDCNILHDAVNSPLSTCGIPLTSREFIKIHVGWYLMSMTACHGLKLEFHSVPIRFDMLSVHSGNGIHKIQ